MASKSPLLKIVEKQHAGEALGIYSACTANDIVLEACMLEAKKTNTLLLIEATANQVNQFGGYTGMNAQDYVAFIESLSEKTGLPMERIILGGDHLGPLTWTHLPEEEAMENSKVLLREFVLAGFTKIHIDTSMKVADDPEGPLSTKVIAKRGAILAEVCEQAFLELKAKKEDAVHPVYIVGSEVPIPGGAVEEEDELQVTRVEDLKETIETFQASFGENFKHVIAVVVQPGVEFADEDLFEYDPKKASELTKSILAYDNLVFEGHSTDYQTLRALSDMVEDHVGILKVGPGLTFALREGLFGLSLMEKALVEEDKQSHFIEVLDQQMLEDDQYWKKHYHGSEEEIAIKRKYSFSDRARYYLPKDEVQEAMKKLIKNLQETKIPLSVISQFMPLEYEAIRSGEIEKEPYEMLLYHVQNTVRVYLKAARQANL